MALLRNGTRFERIGNMVPKTEVTWKERGGQTGARTQHEYLCRASRDNATYQDDKDCADS